MIKGGAGRSSFSLSLSLFTLLPSGKLASWHLPPPATGVDNWGSGFLTCTEYTLASNSPPHLPLRFKLLLLLHLPGRAPTWSLRQQPSRLSRDWTNPGAQHLAVGQRAAKARCQVSKDLWCSVAPRGWPVPKQVHQKGGHSDPPVFLGGFPGSGNPYLQITGNLGEPFEFEARF